MDSNTDILKMLEQGGSIVYVLIGLSVIALAFFIYCVLVLRRKSLFPISLVKIAEGIRDESECAPAEDLCRKTGGALAEVLLTVLMSRKLGREEAEALVEGAGRRAAHSISLGVTALEVIASISPLLGLLGTVMGMYEVFGRISQVGSNEINSLSGGIAQALVTTIVGMIVAIPSYVAYSYFARRVDDRVLEMERLAVGLMLRVRN